MIETIIDDAKITATEKQLLSNINEEEQEIIENMQKRLEQYVHNIYFLNDEGTVKIKIPYQEEEKKKYENYKDKPEINKLLETQKIVISDVFKIQNNNIISINVPIHKELEFNGLLKIDIYLENVFKKYLITKNEKKEHIHIIFNEETYFNENEKITTPKEIINDLKEKKYGLYTGTNLDHHNLNEIIGAYHPINIKGKNWGIFVETEKEEIINTIQKSINNIWFFTAGIVIAIIIIGIIFNYLLTKSLKKEVEERTRKIEEKEVQLIHANIKLKELDKQKDEFISIAAHELKTPLTSIKSYSQLMQNKKIIKDKKKIKKFLKIINNNTNRLYSLVTDLVDSSRINIGKINMNIEEVQPNKILEDIKQTMKPIIEEKKLKTVFTIEKNLPTMMADPDRILQILRNLIINAVHYTEKGTISLKIYQKEKYIQFEIKDTGSGIPKESQANIFSKFYQVDSSLRRKVGGSGLGLSVCQGFVKLMKGKIWFTSEEGKGTTFYFTIPIEKKRKNKY